MDGLIEAFTYPGLQEEGVVVRIAGATAIGRDGIQESSRHALKPRREGAGNRRAATGDSSWQASERWVGPDCVYHTLSGHEARAKRHNYNAVITCPASTTPATSLPTAAPICSTVAHRAP